MQTPEYLPHIDQLLQALRINRERLHGKLEIAIDARLLRGLFQAMVARSPCSESFYMSAYSDIAEAHAAGNIPDLHEAVSRGEIDSPAEHHLRSGAAEGRVPNRRIKPEIASWLSVLRDEPSPA